MAYPLLVKSLRDLKISSKAMHTDSLALRNSTSLFTSFPSSVLPCLRLRATSSGVEYNMLSHYFQFRSRIRSWVLLSFFIMALQACHKENIPNTISFYYWKTHYHLTTFEKNYITQHGVRKIYIRCFDIVEGPIEPKPEAVLQWKDEPLHAVQYIPTVAIVNKVFTNKDTLYLKKLADKTFSLTSQIMAAKQLSFHEIQIDCDWTAETKQAYFYFLTCLKKKNIVLGHTLRLYPYKYRKESGIAPTDYASLMCYNMGNLKKAEAENSILNLEDLNSYLSTSSYPQKLNIALPIFDWVLVYHQQVFSGILYRAPQIDNGLWQKKNASTYICTSSYFDPSCAHDFIAGDQIRIEKLSKEELEKANSLIHKKIQNTLHEVIYFDLDSAKLQHCLY